MSDLTDLPGIGPVLAERLQAVGINSAEQLRQTGSKQALQLIRKEQDPEACLHMLTALEGAIVGIGKKELSPEVKTDLKAFFNSLS